jgi:signal transduction histidine kinase
MSSQKNMLIARSAMFWVNLAVIVFLSTVIYQATELMCHNGLARDFLEKIKYLPEVPWKVPVYSVSLLLLLLASIILRERVFKQNKPMLYLLTFFDIGICIGVMYYLNMSYKGILLLAIANIIIYADGIKRRYLFISAVIIIYILFDYDIFSIRWSMFSINDYIQYYTSAQKLYIFGIRNILTSLNEMIFIVFMMFVIQNQIEENKKIKDLYARLYKVAEELKVANIQLEEYAKKTEEMAKTKERNRLAREIHDTIGHTLTGIATGLEACIELFHVDPERIKGQIVKIAQLAKKGLLEVRRSVSELRPDTLERFSLIPAVRKLAEDINACTKTRVCLGIEGEVAKLSADEEETIYRVVQEGITNAVRHGNAGEIKIDLRFGTGGICLEISDDGGGCENIREGFGLKHIRERVEMLKGNVEFTGKSAKGFVIRGNIPIRRRMEDDQSINRG